MDLLPLVCLCLLTWSGTTFADGNGERVTATEGSDVILPCFLNESLVPMVIIWEKEENLMKKLVFKYNNRQHSNNGLTGQDEEFKGRVFHFPDKLGDGNASIRISNTKITDSGNYRCNIPDRKLFRIELVVGAAPEPIIEILDETKNGVKVMCVVRRASPQPDVQWQDSAGNNLTAEKQKVTRNGDIILTATVTKTDTYTCVATQKSIYHQIQSKMLVTVTDLFLKDRRAENLPGAAPRPNVTILHHTKDWSLLQCEVQGASPQPDVQWQDSDGNTLTAEEPQVTTDGERYDVIVNVTVTKTDTYRCVVTQKEIYHQTQAATYVYIHEKLPGSCHSTTTLITVFFAGAALVAAAVALWFLFKKLRKRYANKIRGPGVEMRSDPRPAETEPNERNQFISPPQGADEKIQIKTFIN